LLLTATVHAKDDWPVFYDAEKGPTHLSISREARALIDYTNAIPSWNIDLLIPKAKIISAEIKEMGKIDGLRVVEARLSLKDIYYTDALMILTEVEPRRFLPVYVQNYHHEVRVPSGNAVFADKKTLTINAGMDYYGTGHFHNRYQITIAPDHDPVVVGSHY